MAANAAFIDDGDTTLGMGVPTNDERRAVSQPNETKTSTLILKPQWRDGSRLSP